MNDLVYPEEYFLKIDENDFLLGRITIHSSIEEDGKEVFNSEIDIVQKETKKIWTHVGYIFRVSSREEAIETAVQKIADYLKQN